MLNEPTIDKLHALRMPAMANAWLEQSKTPNVTELGFDERFAMLVDAEYLARDNRRLARLLKDAQLRLNDACVEDIEASQSRGLDKPMLRQLAGCNWLREHLNVLRATRRSLPEQRGQHRTSTENVRISEKEAQSPPGDQDRPAGQ